MPHGFSRSYSPGVRKVALEFGRSGDEEGFARSAVCGPGGRGTRIVVEDACVPNQLRIDAATEPVLECSEE